MRLRRIKRNFNYWDRIKTDTELNERSEIDNIGHESISFRHKTIEGHTFTLFIKTFVDMKQDKGGHFTAENCPFVPAKARSRENFVNRMEVSINDDKEAIKLTL